MTCRLLALATALVALASPGLIALAQTQRIVRAERTRAASRGQLDLAEKRYAAGLSDIVELEDAERNYTADDAAYVNELYGFSAAKAAVDQATARSPSR